MKTVLIHGQNHKGSSYHIGRMIAEKTDPQAQITEFFLPRDLDHFCTGCYACIEDESKCPYYAEKKRITDAVEEADMLIFTTPTYCMRASAPMKSFIDLTFTYWMVHRPRNCMFSKKAVVVSTAAGSGAKSAVEDVSNALFYWGVPYVKTCGVSVQAMGWEQVADKKKKQIEKAAAKLAKAVSKKTAVRPGVKTKVIFSAMRMMQKAGLGSSESEREYWNSQGWLGKTRPWKDK